MNSDQINTHLLQADIEATRLRAELATRTAAYECAIAAIAVNLDGRAAQLSKAFDFALEQVAGIAQLLGRNCTMVDARIAVKASTMHCGPVARAAESWLLSQGVSGIEFYSLKGHYVLLDHATGLLHDLEVPDGRRSKEDLPIWSRTSETYSANSLEIENIFERYASEWLRRRGELIAIAAVV